jgi:replication-associated recombination protein RarA
MSDHLIEEKKNLEKLTEKDRRGSEQLICLLHGPGGSGKTAVIDLLIAYAREYCSYNEGYQFTS